ncbi:MAG: hypothetical protein SNJ82_04920 [Gemmataceae bacterium]
MPATIQQLLHRLYRRELMQRFVWSLARVAALSLGLLLLCCSIDWWVDRWEDTPYPLRVALLAIQAFTLLGGLVFLGFSLTNRLTADALALWIEDRIPTLGHRLISALQLNRPGADTRGMSPDLIAATTAQAEQLAAQVDLNQVCDGRRYRWAAWTLGFLLVVTLLLYGWMPELWTTLVGRQFLQPWPIPRQVQLENASVPIWPVGETAQVTIAALGVAEDTALTGLVRIFTQRGTTYDLPLLREGPFFVAQVPAGETDFSFRAWLGDGRLAEPGHIRYAPRPVVQTLRAWVRLPTHVISRPDGRPFEELQRGGDVQFRLEESKLRVEITSEVPLQSAQLAFEGLANPPARQSLRVAPDGHSAQGLFDLPAMNLTDTRAAYALYLKSRDNLDGTDIARRGLRRVPLELPEVTLLPETFYKPGDPGTAEDWEVEGIPVLVGERFRTEYRASHRYGISHARMMYRILPVGSDEGEASRLDDSQFTPLPLGGGRKPRSEVPEALRRELELLPSDDVDQPTGLEARGQYDFAIGTLPNGRGGVGLRPGDRIQFYIEVFSRAAPDGPPGRSILREKEVVDAKSYFTWLERKDDLKKRTRSLEEAARRSLP